MISNESIFSLLNTTNIKTSLRGWVQKFTVSMSFTVFSNIIAQKGTTKTLSPYGNVLWNGTMPGFGQFLNKKAVTLLNRWMCICATVLWLVNSSTCKRIMRWNRRKRGKKITSFKEDNTQGFRKCNQLSREGVVALQQWGPVQDLAQCTTEVRKSRRGFFGKRW